MAETRTIEIFSAGCACCNDVVAMVNGLVCESCSVTVLDMHDAEVAARAKALGIRSVPAVVIDGVVADCCASRGVDEDVLRGAGVGRPLA